MKPTTGRSALCTLSALIILLPAARVMAQTGQEKPAFSCCESNIRISPQRGNAATVAKTRLVNNGTQREVEVEYQIPIVFDCELRPETPCIGTFDAAIVQNPDQFNLGTREYDVPPASASVTTSFEEDRCDGKKNHRAVITVTYLAVYPNIEQVKGSLILRFEVPEEKGTVRHELASDVDAVGNTARVKSGQPTPVQPAEPMPEYSCCESNIRIAPVRNNPSVGAGHTNVIDNNTHRRVTFPFQVTILFDCEKIPDQQCVGALLAAVTQNPTLVTAGGQNVQPRSSKVEVKPKVDKCDGRKNHRGTIEIQYEAVFPGSGQVKGTVKIHMTVPGNKGTVNTVLVADVDASGQIAKASSIHLEDPDQPPSD